MLLSSVDSKNESQNPNCDSATIHRAGVFDAADLETGEFTSGVGVYCHDS